MEGRHLVNILVIAAHPDDEILGVGGTLLKHSKNGDNIYICIVTKATRPYWPKKYIDEKVNEQKKVDTILGTIKRYHLGYPTTRLNTVSHGELNAMVSSIVEEVKPGIVYTHFEGDLNYDHTLVFRASMVATRPPKKIQLCCFETLSETEWNNKSFIPNVWVDIGEFINKKTELFNVYRSEVKAYPHPRSLEGIRILAQKRGIEVCIKHAEAFILVRDIRS